MKVDLSNIPIMLNSNQFQSDISTFLGNFYINQRMEKLKKIMYGSPKPTLLSYFFWTMDKSDNLKNWCLGSINFSFQRKGINIQISK